MYDLTSEPWIPIVDDDGERRAVGLVELFEGAHEFKGFAFAEPTVFVAVFRQVVLASVLAASGAARSEDDWRDRFQAGRFPHEVIGYLDTWRERFDLVHPEHPFAQVAGLRAVNGEEKPLSLIVPSEPSGNNVPLFGSRTEAEPFTLPLSEAVGWVLNAHCWDTAAIKSGADGDAKVKGGKTTGNPVGALGRLGVVVPTGRTVFETIMLNVPVSWDEPDERDRPQWERAPATASWEERDAHGQLDLLTWQSRRIRLVVDGGSDDMVARAVILTAGDRLLSNLDHERHTSWRVVEKPKRDDPPRRPLQHQSGRATWQGLGALLALDGTAQRQHFEASRVVEDLAALVDHGALAENLPLGIDAVGVQYGNQSAVVENVIADSVPVPVAALRVDGAVRSLIDRIALDADELASAVDRLDADLRRASGGDPIPWHAGQRPGTRLVQQLDPVVRRLLAGLRKEPERVDKASDAWERVARSVAWQVAQELLGAVPPRAHRGREEDGGKRVHRVAKAEAWFRHRLAEIVPLPGPDDDEREEERKAS